MNSFANCYLAVIGALDCLLVEEMLRNLAVSQLGAVSTKSQSRHQQKNVCV